MDVRYADVAYNLDRVLSRLTESAEQGARLVVFPEAALTGYCASSRADVEGIAIRNDSAAIEGVQARCEQLEVCALVGFAEIDGLNLYNSAAFFEPRKSPRFYRKTHLPFLGMDRFVETGEELLVLESGLGKLAPLICFDLRFPEATRTLALRGAELLMLPTNWPQGAEVSAEVICVARAAENRIFVVTCNRVGTERGFTFIGRSKIISPAGKVLAVAGSEETILLAEIKLADARQKRTIVRPGEYETETFRARRPELYDCP